MTAASTAASLLFNYLGIYSNFLVVILAVMSALITEVRALDHDLVYSHRSACYSCATFPYLHLWPKLMHHYFPPKNFTDRCWKPDLGIETVQCASACFTLVEKIDEQDFPLQADQQGVIRGCVDRLLLFGLDDDVRDILTTAYQQRLCRRTDRKLLRLFPLSADNDPVTLCSCTGDHCNDQDMLEKLNVSRCSAYYILVILLLTFLIS